jgi:hypothetical protein
VGGLRRHPWRGAAHGGAGPSRGGVGSPHGRGCSATRTGEDVHLEVVRGAERAFGFRGQRTWRHSTSRSSFSVEVRCLT